MEKILQPESRLPALAGRFGLPRLIIAGFLLLLFVTAPVVGADLAAQITNTLNRFSWNAVLVLAMVPMIHSGCGLVSFSFRAAFLTAVYYILIVDFILFLLYNKSVTADFIVRRA